MERASTLVIYGLHDPAFWQDAEKVSGWALPDKTEERLNVYARTRHTTERYVQLRIGRRAGASRSPIAADPRDGGSGSERDGIVIFLALPTLLVPLVTLGLMDISPGRRRSLEEHFALCPTGRS